MELRLVSGGSQGVAQTSSRHEKIFRDADIRQRRRYQTQNTGQQSRKPKLLFFELAVANAETESEVHGACA